MSIAGDPAPRSVVSIYKKTVWKADKGISLIKTQKQLKPNPCQGSCLTHVPLKILSLSTYMKPRKA